MNDKYTRGYVAFKIHSFAANGDAALEKNLVHFKNVRIVTENPTRYALPMDLPARAADPTQTVLPKP